MKPDWSRFDSVFVIAYTGHRDRHDALREEFARVGLTDFTTLWQFPTPILKPLMDRFGYSHPGMYGPFNCTMGHYRALKTAYELGHEHVLIFEDDARFLRDTELLARIVNELPDDYDCAKFEWIPNRYKDKTTHKRCIDARRGAGLFRTPNWVVGNRLPTSGTAMVAYSRKGMARKIELMELHLSRGCLIASDDYEMLPEFDDGLSCYLAVPFAAIQEPVYDGSFGPKEYGTDFPHNGTLDSYGPGTTGPVAPAPDNSLGGQIAELLKALSLRGKVRVALAGHVTAEELRAFEASPLVSSVVRLGPDVPDPHPEVDLVYVGRQVAEQASSLARLRQAFGPSVAYAGDGYSFDGSTVRTSVDEVFGLPSQFLGMQLWVVFGTLPLPCPRAWRFSRGRLGNQLYYLLQVHRLGPGNRYASPGDDTTEQFGRLGAGHLVACVKNRDTTCVYSKGQQWNVGTNYAPADVTAFVRDTVLRSRLYDETVKRYGLDADTVALHVRNTDFLTDDLWHPFDRQAYVRDAIAAHRRFGGVSGQLPAVRVFSDDIAVARAQLGQILAAAFESVEYVTPGRAEDDLVRLATHRSKILFNSTFSAWAAHIGDAVFGDLHRVVMPSVFYRFAKSGYVGAASAIAAPGWTLLPVTLNDGTRYPKETP